MFFFSFETVMKSCGVVKKTRFWIGELPACVAQLGKHRTSGIESRVWLFRYSLFNHLRNPAVLGAPTILGVRDVLGRTGPILKRSIAVHILLTAPHFQPDKDQWR